MMKRRLLFAAILLLPATAWAQVTNPLSRVFVIPVSGDCETTPCSVAGKQLCRESTTANVAFMCNATTGMYDTPITGGVLMYQDASTGFIFVFLEGVLRATLTPNGVIPGPCGSNLYAMELGTQCRDYSQDEPRILQKTMSGIVEVKQ